MMTQSNTVLCDPRKAAASSPAWRVWKTVVPLNLVSAPIVVASLVIYAAVGSVVSYSPMWVVTFSVGIPVVLLAGFRRTRYLALVAAFGIAPFMPYVKAITGVRYGPLALDIALMVVVVAVVLDSALEHRCLRWSRPDSGVVLFMAIGIVQVFNPLGPGVLQALEGYRILVWQMVGFLLGRRLVQSPGDVRTVVTVLRIVATLVAIYAVKQYFLPSDLDGRMIELSSGDSVTYTALDSGRAFSTMSSPFHLSFLMTIMIILNVSVLELSRHKIAWIAQTLLFGVALLVAIVRTGWIGLVVGLVSLWLLKAVEKRRVVGSVGQLVLIGATLVLVSQPLLAYYPDSAITQRVASLTALTEESSYTGRVNSWPDVILPAIAANPFGYGVGSDNTTRNARFYSHNGFFYIAIEMGVPALLLVLLILAGAIRSSFRTCLTMRDPMLRSIGLWVLACWASIMVMGTFGAFIEVYPVSLYLWFFLGLITVLPEIENEHGATNEQDTNPT